MSGIMTALLMVLSSAGWGTLLLRLTGAASITTPAERFGWSFTLGMGVLGWLGFWTAALFGVSAATLWAPVVIGLAGLAVLARGPLRPPRDPWLWALGALALTALVLDGASALVPPVDGDSMAYHFALPKAWLRSGHLDFVPQAVEAAVPLLLHVTYLQALGLGGETGLTLWCGLNAWFLPLAVAVTGMRYLPPRWAFGVALLIKLLPAVVYGSPAGQVEVRLAAFFFVAVFAAARARRSQAAGPAALAGLAAGLCMAVKYSGLVAPAACGLLMLAPGAWFRRAVAFGLLALLAGGQWYGWNALHTGDPLFPMLWGHLPYRPETHWDGAMAEVFKGYLAMEHGVPATFGWFLAYPFQATFDGLPAFESGRTGFGPYGVLILPFALIGAWKARRHWRDSDLGWVLAACVLGYALWFFGGSSQRVRHFLPYFVPAVIALTAAARPIARPAPAIALGLTLLIQLGGLAVFAQQNVVWLLTSRDRDAYLSANLSSWPVARWLNGHLGPHDTVLITLREINYLIDPPTFLAMPNYEAVIPLPPGPDAAQNLARLRDQGITHLVVNGVTPGQAADGDMARLAGPLLNAGCLRQIGAVATPGLLRSRTLGLRAEGEALHYVYAVGGPDCRLP